MARHTVRTLGGRVVVEAAADKASRCVSLSMVGPTGEVFKVYLDANAADVLGMALKMEAEAVDAIVDDATAAVEGRLGRWRAVRAEFTAKQHCDRVSSMVPDGCEEF